MGHLEVEDQARGLNKLIDEGIVHPTRIGVYGWSYGGYLSCMLLAQKPQSFRVAVSCAPVIMWEAYDTGYTERYLKLPQDNAEGYVKSSVLNFVNSLPDQDNRLFLVHGLKDENVHFCHTAQLIDELNSLGKPYRLYCYPNERHGLRNGKNLIHAELNLLKAWQYLLE